MPRGLIDRMSTYHTISENVITDNMNKNSHLLSFPHSCSFLNALERFRQRSFIECNMADDVQMEDVDAVPVKAEASGDVGSLKREQHDDDEKHRQPPPRRPVKVSGLDRGVVEEADTTAMNLPERVESAEKEVAANCWDTDAWMVLFQHAQAIGIPRSRPILNRFLTTFPTAVIFLSFLSFSSHFSSFQARYWKYYIEQELNQKNFGMFIAFLNAETDFFPFFLNR
jgi:hypothetical protein